MADDNQQAAREINHDEWFASNVKEAIEAAIREVWSPRYFMQRILDINEADEMSRPPRPTQEPRHD